MRWTGQDAPTPRDYYWLISLWVAVPVYLWIAYEMIRVEVLL